MKRYIYSRPQDTETADGRRIRQYPEFDVDVLADNIENPSSYTFYPRERRDTTTEWISADVGITLPVEECV